MGTIQSTGISGWGPFDYIVVIGVGTILLVGVLAIFRAIRIVTKDS
ncbi:hypothetical protein ACSYAY_11160 [Leptospirillum ferriphilum]|jgi:hypothetical protein|uniref:Uncharacterized protein n=2 Tax=Leptospirillum TaxID=179 RepID=A0A094X2F4_9BACT|nr:hypothetical protein [Leptospirillum ferriphilum]EDZ39336.1 MAG: Hypothetical protein CGL2_11233034 [Leptospirillum sp. Group II '5-way CG']KGA92744.1 hypothetical protein LptCag_0479 [Leptospirillum ferriphilum]